jgi:hypothetical protein
VPITATDDDDGIPIDNDNIKETDAFEACRVQHRREKEAANKLWADEQLQRKCEQEGEAGEPILLHASPSRACSCAFPIH